MKRILAMTAALVFALLCFFCTDITTAYAEAPTENTNEGILQNEVTNSLTNAELWKWDEFASKLQTDAQTVLKGKSISETIADLASGKAVLDTESFLDYIWKTFAGGFGQYAGSFIKIAVIGIACTILNNLRGAFGSEGVGETAYYVCFILIVAVILQNLYSMTSLAMQAVGDMVDMMQFVFPAILVLMTAIGGIAASGIFQPAMAMLSGSLGSFMGRLIVPLITMTGILAVVGNLSKWIRLDRLQAFFKSVCVWTMGITFTVFLGIISIQGMTATTVDGLSIRTAKYALDKMVPVVGGMLSDTVDTIVGCSLIAKNAIGTGSIILLFLTIVQPLMMILLNAFLFKALSAVLDIVADDRIVKCLSSVADVTIILFSAVLVVGAMFYITITLAVGSGNANVMLR